MVSVPSAPGPFQILTYTNTSVTGGAHDPSSMGGGTILEWQIGWGLSPNQADFTGTLATDGSGFIVGLTQGETYYFWNRIRNEAGWSPMSARSSVTLRDHPDPPKTPTTFIFKTQTSVRVVVSPNGDGQSRITQYKLIYGQTQFGPVGTTVTQSTPIFVLTGLNPGQRYYFWAKAVNIYGESNWSPRGFTDLIAGAMIKVGPVWRRAVPYVKVAGVWTLARTWVRSSGEWHETAD